MHRKCFTVNTLRNLKRHRLLHQGLLPEKWYLFLYSSFKQLNSHKNSILHNFCENVRLPQPRESFAGYVEGGCKKKAKQGSSASTQHTPRKHYWLLMALMLPQMTHPSIHNTSITRAMQQQGDVKAAVSIGVGALH